MQSERTPVLRVDSRPLGYVLAMIQQQTLPPEPASASAARRFAQSVLTEWHESELADVVALLVSELVTNAVLHAGSPVQVAVRRRGDCVRIEVADDSPVLPGLRDYSDDATTGRGLGMLEMLAETWGVEAAATGGKVVWFELPASQQPVAPEEKPAPPSVVVLPEDEIVIRLVGAPVRLFPAAQQHTDALLREYALVALQVNPDSAAPHLLLDTRAVATQLQSAIEVGSPTVDLVVAAPASVRDSVIEACDALRVADGLASDGKLLNAPALAEVRACRDWYLSEVLAQLDGRPATPWAAAAVASQRRDHVDIDHRLVVQNLGTAIVVADDENHIVYANAATEELLGWGPGELEGQRLTAIIPQRLHEAHVAGYTRFLVTRQPRLLGQPVRVPALRHDGTEVDIELVITTFTPAGGRQMFAASLQEAVVEPGVDDAAERWLAVVPDLVATDAVTHADLLESLATRLSWDFAAWWEVRDERLHCAETWSRNRDRYIGFEKVTRTRRFRLGEGLPGRVWEQCQPEWLTDVVRDSNFPRVSLALEHGLRTACAFPIVAAGEVVGVVELFTPQLRPANDAVVAVLETLGRVAGMVIAND